MERVGWDQKDREIEYYVFIDVRAAAPRRSPAREREGGGEGGGAVFSGARTRTRGPGPTPGSPGRGSPGLHASKRLRPRRPSTAWPHSAGAAAPR